MKKVLLLVFALSLFSCSSEDSTTEPIVPSNAIVYFTGSLDGQALNYSQMNYVNPTHSYSFYNGSSSGPDFFDTSYHYGCIMQPYPSQNFYPQISLIFSNMFNTNSGVSESDAFYGLFANTPTNFITMDQEYDLVEGVHVSYQSPSGTTYSSLSGDQTGSTMTVTSSVSGIEEGGSLKIQTLVGTVSCKLYNETNASDVIVLTGGAYKVILREFN